MHRLYWFPTQTRLLAVLLPLGVMIIAFMVYLPTLAPTISWRNGGTDSGELAAVVATLGIAHPPGYPTYILLGRGWTALPLGGDLAYRLNLLSAAGAALAAALSTLTILLLGRRLALSGVPLVIGSVLGGLFLALAPLTWSQATITEVYAPGLAVLSLFTLLLFWEQNQRQPIRVVVVGVVGGLGLGVLPQLVLAIPGAIGWLYFQRRFFGANKDARHDAWPYIFTFLAGIGLGLSVFAYLPVRAAAHPAINWGDPSSLSRFWDLVTVAQYRRFVGTPDATEWFRRLLESLNRLGQDLSWAGFGLAVPGGYMLWQHDRAKFGYFLSLVVLTLVFRSNYYVVINNLVYLLPVLYSLALLAGLGVAWLLTMAKGHIGPAGAALLGIGLVVALGWRAVGLAPLLDASTDESAALFGQRALSTLPPNAVVISERDETTFSLWYRQSLGERLDVVVVDNRLLVYDWYQRNLWQRHPDLNPTAIKSGRLSVVNRPIYQCIGIPGEEEVKLQPVQTTSQ